LRPRRDFALTRSGPESVCLIVELALFGDLRQPAVMPSPYATNKADLIEMLTYCRARA